MGTTSVLNNHGLVGLRTLWDRKRLIRGGAAVTFVATGLALGAGPAGGGAAPSTR